MAEREIMGDAFGPGSRAVGVEPPSGVSPVPASIPIAWSLELRAEDALERIAYHVRRGAMGDARDLMMCAMGEAHYVGERGAWRPIETAPNGTRVLIAGRYANGIGWVEESSRYYHGHFPGRKLEPPTHWMPIPEPPAQGIEAFGRDAASRLDAKHESPTLQSGDAP